MLSPYTFVDMFAGLGGFHIGLGKLGMECVFACEKDEELACLYQKNFGSRPGGDIRSIKLKSIPDHDIFCAGFPCQPFSKAGEQLGLSCKKDGDLFSYIVRILKEKQPPCIILENVANLERHNTGKTYKQMRKKLELLGYTIDQRVLSPESFGIPQVRKRLFIVGTTFGLDGFQWPEGSNTTTSVFDVLDEEPENPRYIGEHYVECILVWQDFLNCYPAGVELPSFPIWSMEFGADYPFEDRTPLEMTPRQLLQHRGAFGVELKNLPPKERHDAIPRYARRGSMPEWKKDFIRQNRELYQMNRDWIDAWLPKIAVFPFSLQKMEWNCKGESRQIRDHILQFRASGLRIKRSVTAPTLIAMTTTQVPIIGRDNRFMTVKECSRLQGMGAIEHLPATESRAYRALGNAVNADIVEQIGARLEKLLNVRKMEFAV